MVLNIVFSMQRPSKDPPSYQNGMGQSMNGRKMLTLAFMGSEMGSDHVLDVTVLFGIWKSPIPVTIAGIDG